MVGLNGRCARVVYIVLCPAGTRLSGAVCEKCAEGTYNDRDGQVACTACPQDRSDSPAGSDNVNDCRALTHRAPYIDIE